MRLFRLAPNFSRLEAGELTVWFSYDTPIGFHYPGRGHVARVNEWGPTTGKHLNALEAARADRLEAGEFLEALKLAQLEAARDRIADGRELEARLVPLEAGSRADEFERLAGLSEFAGGPAPAIA
jgi:hypothetical protein